MDRLGRKKRIGILGGTFNPVHFGHLFLAETARKELRLDEVIFIPAKRPPHKNNSRILDVKLRYKMIKYAIAGNKFFSVSKIEIEKPGISYSVDTLRILKEKQPKAEVFFLVGSDALPELCKWKRIDEIFTLCYFVIAQRPEFIKGPLPKKTLMLKGDFLNISSTFIRNSVRLNKTIRYLVPEKVLKFIKKERLYGFHGC
ncbi:MAG: nicotinate-nucleotide adenylyltransferase [Candidatus Omnitrophica bacterium]|nr:nicotinate-nucleotide adenylyltransferase [Candidatus Omnitrophota bacterium]